MTGLRICVPLDPTRPVSRAVDVAVGLAAPDAVVELVAVTSRGLPGAVVDVFLQAEARRFPEAEIECRRLDGAEVVELLLRHIARTGPDLVVLESHGRGPLGELVLGSVSADLVRSSSSPTMLVGPACTGRVRLRQLTVAVDGSPDSLGALDVAFGLSRRLPVALELVEVAEELVCAGDVAESAELHRLAERVDPPVRSWDVLHGHDVPKALIDHVGSARDVVLVVGAHGRSPARPHVIGGTAARTVRRSPVPVLVVSPEAARSAGAPPAAGVRPRRSGPSRHSPPGPGEPAGRAR